MNPVFTPLCLNFETLSTEQQARKILDQVNELNQLGYKKIAITYSANDQQTSVIREYNRDDNPNKKLTIAGANQAAVIAEISQLLSSEYKHLIPVFCVMPLTTISFGGKLADKTDEIDLDYIEKFMQESNHAILGWQNQKTYPHYAVGGGVDAAMPANCKLTQEQKENIQTKLEEFKRRYSQR